MSRRAAITDGLVAIADRNDGPQSLVQVCIELGGPVGTLNAPSNSVLGMSAAVYLRRRRLHRAFRDLGQEPGLSVTAAAIRHGVWQLGQFTAQSRQPFGEAPYDTRRPLRMRRLAGPSRMMPAPSKADPAQSERIAAATTLGSPVRRAKTSNPMQAAAIPAHRTRSRRSGNARAAHVPVAGPQLIR